MSSSSSQTSYLGMGQERQPDKKVQPSRIQSTSRTEKRVAQNGSQDRTELSLGLEVVKDAVDSYMEALFDQSSLR